MKEGRSQRGSQAGVGGNRTTASEVRQMEAELEELSKTGGGSSQSCVLLGSVV